MLQALLLILSLFIDLQAGSMLQEHVPFLGALDSCRQSNRHLVETMPNFPSVRSKVMAQQYRPYRYKHEWLCPARLNTQNDRNKNVIAARPAQ